MRNKEEKFDISLLRDSESQSRARITSIQSGLTHQEESSVEPQPSPEPQQDQYMIPVALKGKERVQQQVIQLLFQQAKHKARVRNLLLEKRQAERQAAILRFQQSQAAKQTQQQLTIPSYRSRNRINQLHEDRRNYFK